MINIFFDLDGTIVNSQHRLYNLFVELCSKCKLSYDEYWQIKKQKINQRELLKKYFNYSDKQCESFHKLWIEKVEEPERLRQDFLFDGMREVLFKLSKKYNLYVVTNRQSKELTLKQLETLDIKKYFKDILVTQQKSNKDELIRKNIKIFKDSTFIGDTEEDIKCAKILNIKSIAVTWGFLNENILKKYLPDIIINEVRELENYFI